MMIIPYTHPQEHIIVVEVDWLNEQFERNVGYDLYNEVSVGDSVMIEVRIKQTMKASELMLGDWVLDTRTKKNIAS